MRFAGWHFYFFYSWRGTAAMEWVGTLVAKLLRLNLKERRKEVPELLVLFACLNKTGCSETSSQYYSQHPELQEFVKDSENRIKDAAGPIMTQYGAPLIWAASGQEATTRLSTRFYLTFSVNTQILKFKQEW